MALRCQFDGPGLLHFPLECRWRKLHIQILSQCSNRGQLPKKLAHGEFDTIFLFDLVNRIRQHNRIGSHLQKRELPSNLARGQLKGAGHQPHQLLLQLRTAFRVIRCTVQAPCVQLSSETCSGAGKGPLCLVAHQQLSFMKPISFSLKWVGGKRQTAQRCLAIKRVPVYLDTLRVQCRQAVEHRFPVPSALVQRGQAECIRCALPGKGCQHRFGADLQKDVSPLLQGLYPGHEMHCLTRLPTPVRRIWRPIGSQQGTRLIGDQRNARRAHCKLACQTGQRSQHRLHQGRVKSMRDIEYLRFNALCRQSRCNGCDRCRTTRNHRMLRPVDCSDRHILFMAPKGCFHTCHRGKNSHHLSLLGQ